MKNEMWRKLGGFTLIELLVVVLIIGILAVVAVPQYQKAVEKSRAAQAITLLKSVYQSALAYQLANGSWPESTDALSVEIPWNGTEAWRSVGDARDPHSNGDWSLQIYRDANQGVIVGRLNGKYAGAGFGIFMSSTSNIIPLGQVVCLERTSYGVLFQGEPGDYCSKLFKGIYKGSSTARVYQLLS